jgi:hypothetical protein
LSAVEELALKAEQKGDSGLYNCVWSYYLLKKNFEKAREIWETKARISHELELKSV